eukprot:maker-scaffold871_size86487-snap-gene-0.22 protein:Tk08306 transcript:maker-scaffold871_size86487-snap-gene-0.22-mRNA-1 annotation:"hypothetical protein DAPPUDRAFT_306274"
MLHPSHQLQTSSSHRSSPRRHKRKAASEVRNKPAVKLNPDSLLDICAKCVGQKIPFQQLEESYDRIPEPVQERVIFWSFPRNERDIRMYSSQAQVPSSSQEYHNSPFCRGIKLLEQGCVQDVLQVGFHLSGVIGIPSQVSLATQGLIHLDKTYKVSMSFDRCKITTVNCDCDAKDIFWCAHVVALSLFRIRHPDKVQLRVPISETLLQMNREQLQKFVQYLISSHHTEVLPTAQKLADDILQQRSVINQISGAPDPTAGAAIDDASAWHLDESQIQDQVKAYLSQGGYSNNSRQLGSMFAKVREMLRAKDSNGTRMLALMTEQFLSDPRLVLWKSQGSPMTDKCRQLWDQLGSLWVTIVLNPSLDSSEKKQVRTQLSKWSKLSVCPSEDPDYRTNSSTQYSQHRAELAQVYMSKDEQEIEAKRKYPILGPNPMMILNSKSKNNLPRTIFHKPMDALDMNWDHPGLKIILHNDSPPAKDTEGLDFNEKGYLIWQEHIPTACARVDALHSHGFTKESLRLAVAVVRAMKFNQTHAQAQWKKHQGAILKKLTSSGVARHPGYAAWEGWIGHPLNPIGCVFDILAGACISRDHHYGQIQQHPHHLDLNTSSDEISSSPSERSREPYRYRRIYIPGQRSKRDTYMSLALECALIGLGQQRVMPVGLYSQEKASRQEENLIHKLTRIEMDSNQVQVLCNQTKLLLDMGPSSGLGLGIHTESYPMHTFAKFLFLSILPFDNDLSFTVGLRAMRLPILESLNSPMDQSEDGHNDPSFAISRFPRWFTLGHIEAEQSTLASTMLHAAKGDLIQLRTVMEVSQKSVHSSTHLFKLAQDAFRYALPSPPPVNLTSVPADSSAQRNPALLDVAFQLGLQVLRITLTSLNWRRRDLVRWLVTCATEVGFEALLSILKNWHRYFTPTEASGTIATSVMSHATIVRLSLNFAQQEEIASCARTLALQCAHEDPSGCSLNALTLCENEPIAFETAYQIVVDGADNAMTASQLFTIARYMEHRGYPHRAYKLALLAIRSVKVLYNQDTHPAINDIHWTCALCLSLSKADLSSFAELVVNNVQCASVLSDILRRCTIPATLGSAKLSKRMASPENENLDKPPMKELLEATIAAFVTTTHSRLSSISPRHYTEFIDFLGKARDTFLLCPSGAAQFQQLLENMKQAYKGKKKLISLVKARFG